MRAPLARARARAQTSAPLTASAYSSRPQIFKAGGITPFLLEQALGLDFAMRPRANAEPLARGAADAAAADAAAADADAADCACEAALDLAFSLRGRFGFSCAHVAALCEVVAAGAGDAARPIGVLREAAAAALAKRGVSATAATAAHAESPLRALEPRLALTVTEAAARRVGAASGWRATPVGNVSFAWAFAAAPVRLAVRASVPFATEGAPLELPLALFPAGATVRVSVGGARAFVVDAEGRVVAALGGGAEADVWRPEVLACAGAAARHVSGRVLRGGTTCNGRILLLRVPGGVHELAVEEEEGRQ